MTVPTHVHDVVDAALPVTEACRLLHAEASVLLALALASAAERTRTVVDAAGFRSGALPTVTVLEPAAGELGCLTFRLDGDEEATAWPAMTATVVVTPTREGRTRLALLSTRSPGYDLSTNRIDKVWRDRLARTALRALLTSLAHELEARGGVAAPLPEQRRLVPA